MVIAAVFDMELVTHVDGSSAIHLNAYREQQDRALKVLTMGDTLVVTRLDRLGRSLRDLAISAHEIKPTGAALRRLEQSVSTSTSVDVRVTLQSRILSRGPIIFMKTGPNSP